MHTPTRIPKSISHWLDPFIIVVLSGVLYALLRNSSLNNLLLAIVLVTSITCVMGAIELFRAPWSPTRNSVVVPKRTLRQLVDETALQWFGMILNFLIVMVAWSILVEYRSAYYAPFFDALPLLIVAAPILTAGVLFASEIFCGPSQKGGKEIALFVIRGLFRSPRAAFKDANWAIIRDEILSWLLFGFFLPLNFVEIVKSLEIVRGQEMLIFSGNWAQAQFIIVTLIYGALITAITPGYLFGSRLIRTETRAVDHSWFGWTITLICYDPIVSAVFGRWLDYRVAVGGPAWLRPWSATLAGLPPLFLLVGVIIIFSELIHLWGEAQFGLRASNISNRGVITTGLFRLSKHPIFVSKCFGWFFIWVPFMAGGSFAEDLRLTILWAIVCVIYILRAVAEERIMSTDPDYVTYALYMDKHGMFAWVGKLLPFMTFEYRLKKWREAGFYASHVSSAVRT